MHSIKELDLPPRMVLAVLKELRQEGVLPKRQRQAKLVDYLVQLEIVRFQDGKWTLIATERLDKLIHSVRTPAKTGTANVLRKMHWIHHKTAAAWRGDSKNNKKDPLMNGQIVTTDEVIRLRSFNTSLKIALKGSITINADEETRIRTEVLIPQRLMLQIAQIAISTTTLIVTVENLGAFVDFPIHDSVLLIYSPGQDFSAVACFINKFFDKLSWVHFPDLDPNGIQIAEQLASALGREVSIWIPSHWDTVRRKSLAGTNKLKWSEISPPNSLSQLVVNEQWIEQEVLIADQRFESIVCELPFQKEE